MATKRSKSKWVQAASYIREGRPWPDLDGGGGGGTTLACCTAMDIVDLHNWQGLFSDLFHPDQPGAYWWGLPGEPYDGQNWPTPADERKRQCARILALCFMAAMEEAGDL